MWLMSAILPNCAQRAPTGSTLIVPTRGVEGAFLIQMNSEIHTVMSAACQLSATPNLKWMCRDAIWDAFQSQHNLKQRNTWQSLLDLVLQKMPDGVFTLKRHKQWVGAWCPLPPVSSSAPCLFVWQKYCVLRCWPHGLWVLLDWKGRRISCFLLYRGSARVCRRHDSLIFLF